MHKGKLFRYLLLLAICSVVLLYGVDYMQSKAAHSALTRSTRNSAQLYSLNNSLTALASPEVIIAGQSSGRIPGIISQYDSLVKSIESTPPATVTNDSKILLPGKTKKYKAVLNEHLVLVDRLKKDIAAQKEHILALQKFIEYNPSIELQDARIEDENTKSRISKTKDGIASMIADLKKTNSPVTKNSAAQLQGLLDIHYPALTNGDFRLWIEAVTKTQNELIQGLAKDHKAYVEKYSSQLRETASYWTEFSK